MKERVLDDNPYAATETGRCSPVDRQASTSSWIADLLILAGSIGMLFGLSVVLVLVLDRIVLPASEPLFMEPWLLKWIRRFVVVMATMPGYLLCGFIAGNYLRNISPYWLLALPVCHAAFALALVRLEHDTVPLESFVAGFVPVLLFSAMIGVGIRLAQYVALQQKRP